MAKATAKQAATATEWAKWARREAAAAKAKATATATAKAEREATAAKAEAATRAAKAAAGSAKAAKAARWAEAAMLATVGSEYETVLAKAAAAAFFAESLATVAAEVSMAAYVAACAVSSATAEAAALGEVIAAELGLLPGEAPAMDRRSGDGARRESDRESARLVAIDRARLASYRRLSAKADRSAELATERRRATAEGDGYGEGLTYTRS